MGAAPFAAAAHPEDKKADAERTERLDEVTVTGTHDIDPQVLDHVVVPRFVQSHAATNDKTGQIGRWVAAICPATNGLQPHFNTFVSRRIEAVAASVGAPTKVGLQCTPNVGIIFTPEPQKQLDLVVRNAPAMLGFHYAAQTKELTTFTHAIQAWYVTATRGGNGMLQVDSEFHRPPAGRADSRLGASIRSEFAHVLIIVDSSKLSGFTLGSIADYLAVLTLNRSPSLEGCSELPSILDLMSPGCRPDARPQGLTATDSAYLKALYSANLEHFLAGERNEIHDAMLKALQHPTP